jgi:hypothetical protein
MTDLHLEILKVALLLANRESIKGFSLDELKTLGYDEREVRNLLGTALYQGYLDISGGLIVLGRNPIPKDDRVKIESIEIHPSGSILDWSIMPAVIIIAADDHTYQWNSQLVKDDSILQVWNEIDWVTCAASLYILNKRIREIRL